MRRRKGEGGGRSKSGGRRGRIVVRGVCGAAAGRGSMVKRDGCVVHTQARSHATREGTAAAAAVIAT